MSDGPSLRGKWNRAPEDGGAGSPRAGSSSAAGSSGAKVIGADRGAESELSSIWLVAAGILGLALAGLIALYWETAASAVRTWADSSLFGHGFLIVPLCGYLLWQRRSVLARMAPRPCFWGFAAIALMAFAWRVGEATAILLVQQFALIGMIQALFLTILGPRVVRAIAFPLFYLVFAVPFGAFLIAPLQVFTAEFVVGFLQLAGVPVRTDGLLIHIPSASFLVAEACAGVRFLLVSLALGVLAAQLFYRGWTRRILFVGLSVAVPIIANGLRAGGIVLIAHLRDVPSAVDFDHVTYGLVFLSFVMLCLLALGMTFRERGWDGLRAAPPAPNLAVARAAGSFPAFSLAGSGALLLAAAAVVWAGVDARRAPFATPARLSPPSVSSPWRPLGVTPGTWRPSFPGADSEILASYADAGRRVDLYLAYYDYERQGAEVVNELNKFADGEVWRRVGGGAARARLEGRPRTLGTVRLVSPAGGRLVWYWYWVDGRFTSNPFVAKVLQAKV